MLKTRKILALILTIAMMAALFVPTSLAVVTVIEGDGTVEVLDVDLEIQFSLPTSEKLKFYLDPEGLLAGFKDAAVGATLTSDDLKELAGGIIFAHGAPALVNESAHELDVKIDMKITQGSDTSLTIATPGSISDDTQNNVYFSVSISQEDVADKEAGREDFVGYLTAPLGTDTSAYTPNWVLEDAIYVATKAANGYSYELKGGTGHGTQLLFDGLCNPNAEWDEFFNVREDERGERAVYTLDFVSSITGLSGFEPGSVTSIDGIDATYRGTGYNIANNEFSHELFSLVSILNANNKDSDFNYSASGTSLVATAKEVGERISGSASSLTIEDGTPQLLTSLNDGKNTSTKTSLIEGKRVGLSLSFTFDKPDDDSGIPDTPGAYGYVASGSSIFEDNSEIKAERAALHASITSLQDAIDNAIVTETTTSLVTAVGTAATPSSGAYRALEIAKDVAEGLDAPDKAFDASIAKLEYLIAYAEALIAGEDPNVPVGPTTSGFLGSTAFPVTGPNPATSWAREISKSATGESAIGFQVAAGLTIKSIAPQANPTNVFAQGTDYTFNANAVFANNSIAGTGVLTITSTRMATMRDGQPVGGSISWLITLSNDSTFTLTWNVTA